MSEQIEKKKIFYQKIKPYVDESLVRVVFSGDAATILACGEICYVACMHDLMDELRNRKGQI